MFIRILVVVVVVVVGGGLIVLTVGAVVVAVGVTVVGVGVVVGAAVVVVGLTSEHVHIAIARSAGLKSTASRSRGRSLVRLSEENALMAYTRI